MVDQPDMDGAVAELLLRVGPAVDQSAAELRDNPKLFNGIAIHMAHILEQYKVAVVDEDTMVAIAGRDFRTMSVLALMALRNVADNRQVVPDA